MIYLVVLLLGVVLSLKYDGKYTIKDNKYINIYIFILTFLSAISNNLGADACTFREQFGLYTGDYSKEDFIKSIILYGYMPFWTGINKLAVAWGYTYTFVQTIIALSINSVVGYFLKKSTDYPFISLVLYFLISYFYLNFEIQRESIAIAFGFIGIMYFLKGQKLLFWIFVSIAILFHISAICLLAFPFIPFFKLSWTRLFFAFCISLAIYLVSDFFVKYIPTYEGSIGDKIVSYTNRTVTIFGFLLHTIRRMFVPFVSYLIVSKIYSLRYQYIDRFIPFYLCFSILACSLPGTSRFINYMIPVGILIMSDLFVALCKNRIKINKVLLAIFVGVLYIWQNVSNMINYFPSIGYHRYDLYIPYTTIYDDAKDVKYRDLIHKEALQGDTDDNKRKD